MPIYTNDFCDDGMIPFRSPLISSLGINPKITKAIDAATKDWLDEHPEATTTVEDDSITNAKLKDDSVNTRTIEDKSITTDKINNLAVTTPKIANHAVTAAKIDASAADGLRVMSPTQLGVAKVGAGLAINNDALELDGGDITPAVAAWLDAHPEATTTVQDNSITDNKLIQTGGVLSEVHDIRTCVDGSVRITAGDAVRAQIYNLINRVNDNASDITSIISNEAKLSDSIHFYFDPMMYSFELIDMYSIDTLENRICDYNNNPILFPVYSESSLEKIEKLSDSLAFHYELYDVPAIYLYGDMNGISKKDKVTLNYVIGNYYGTCSLKWQGASSIAYPKKNYTITLDKQRTVVASWGNQKKYVLKANWIDFSHLRNIVSAGIWGQIVRYRNREYDYITDYPDENIICDMDSNRIRVYSDPMLTTPNYGAINGFPVSLVINDEYQGLYSMNIPKDGWMMFMDGNNDAAIISAEGGDYIATQFKGLSAPIEDEKDFSLEYAANEDDTSWITQSLNTAIQAVLDNMRNPNFIEAVNPYLDIQSALDYMIFSAATCNIDGVGRNYLLSTFDKVQWRFTAYDLDSTFGNEPYGKFFYDPLTRATLLSTKYANNAFGIIYDNAKPMLIQRYKQLRSNVLSNGSIMTIFYNYQARIPDIFYAKEQELWTTIPSTRSNNIEQVISFFIQHMSMLDKEVEALEQSIN